MSQFYVGQRVRIRWSDDQQWCVGMEAVITEAAPQEGVNGGSYEYGIAIEGVGGYCANGYELEPILPEGWQTVEWSDCLWQPEGIGA